MDSTQGIKQMAYNAQQFFDKIKPMVIADMKNTGILASLTAAQAFIESGKGNSGLTTKANNLFGIKGEYNGQFVTMLTTEYINGIPQKVNAKFRKYPSWPESITDHSGLFLRASRYANLRGCKDYKLACVYVQQDGYATSPTYAQTLIKTIETYKLYTWDGIEAKPTGNPYAVPTKNLKKGSRGNDVRWLQYELTSRGYALVCDGIFGPKTDEAVRAFQADNGLVPDGIAGPLTRAKLGA